MAADTRIVYGAQCTWWDSITQVACNPNGLPCCPHCHGMLFEVENETKWWDQVDTYSTVEHGYRSLIEWGRGKCYPNYQTAKVAFIRHNEEQNND